MGRAFINEFSMDRPINKLEGKDKELANSMTSQVIDRVYDRRNNYKLMWKKADDAIRVIADNHRIKNKQVPYELEVARMKNFFNYRSMDYYMYRIGMGADWNETKKEGIEYQLYELMNRLEDTLHTFGMYKGYGMCHWGEGNGYDEWVKAGEPDFVPEVNTVEDMDIHGKEFYIREDLGVLYI